MTFGEVTNVGEITFGEMAFGDLTFGEVAFDEMTFGEVLGNTNGTVATLGIDLITFLDSVWG